MPLIDASNVGETNPPPHVDIEPGRGYLAINSCGDIMRFFYDAAGNYVGCDDHSIHNGIKVEEFAAQLGRVPNQRDYDAEHDRRARAFLRPEEIPAYEHYMRMLTQFGEGSVDYTAADGTTWAFCIFHNDLSGGCWLIWEPCHPIADTAFWDRIAALVEETGAWQYLMEEGVGLVSQGDVIDRQVAINFRLTGLTDQQARALGQSVAEKLARTYQPAPPA